MRVLHLALFILPIGMLAQYGGGNGRGDAALAYSSTPLASTLYVGGNGRGDVALAFVSSPIPSDLFSGGNGRGDVALAYNSTPIASNLFSGGNGRGDVAVMYTPTPFANTIFSGGDGRGDVALLHTAPPHVFIAVHGFLEGPYDASTGTMSDALRSAVLIPANEPFTGLGYAHVGGGGEAVAPAVFTTTGNNAIVDWVVLELRSASTPASVLTSKSALIQRDGDVVAIDGVSFITFDIPAGNYYVALRHRNHLGVMTASAVALANTATAVDFSTAATATYGTNARKSVTGTFPTQALWAGDVTFNHQIQYTGSGNDRDPILVTVGSTTPNTVLSNTYSTRDVNMNGNVQYTGSGNDRDPILVNVGSTTPNNVRGEQVP